MRRETFLRQTLSILALLAAWLFAAAAEARDDPPSPLSAPPTFAAPEREGGSFPAPAEVISWPRAHALNPDGAGLGRPDDPDLVFAIEPEAPDPPLDFPLTNPPETTVETAAALSVEDDGDDWAAFTR
jgi:hypothetical protein